MAKIEPAFCSRVSLQFLLVTSLCVIDCSVREWDVAVAMLTLGKICTAADVTKEIRSSFPRAAVFCTPCSFISHVATHFCLMWLTWQCFDMWFSCWEYIVVVVSLRRSRRYNSNDGDQRHLHYSVLLNRAHLMCSGINQSPRPRTQSNGS